MSFKKFALFYLIFALMFIAPAAMAETYKYEIAQPSQEFQDWLEQQNSSITFDQAGSDPGHATGYIPDPVDYSHLDYTNFAPSGITFDRGTLPDTYDLRTLNRVSTIRDQGSYGTCWAHAAMGALESSYLTQGLGSEPNLSELHLAYFVYKDPETGKAFTIRTSSQFGSGVLNQGGNSTMSIAFLSRMAGAVNESSMPYTGASTVDTDASGKSPSDYFPRTIFLTDAYRIGNLSTSDTDYAEKKEIIKQLIMDNGAVQISYYAGTGATSSAGGVASYYDDTSGTSTNHAVLLVGWDDNYSASNFTAGSTPSSNGAWIVRNSWGADWPSSGAGGYFYMSYEQYIANITSYIVSSTIPGENYYGYDDLGNVGSFGYTSAKNWMANVFQANGDEKLNAVGFYTLDVNTSYEVYLFNLGASKPSQPVPSSVSGVTAVASGTFAYAGYHTVVIPSEFLLSAGDYFSVVVSLTESSNGGGTIPIEKSSSNYSDNCVVNAGESYYYVGDTIPAYNEWKDGSTESTPRNVCVKAFTSNVDSSTDTAGTEITSSLFPDSTFKSFVTSNFDTDGDGYLSASEIAAVTEINVSNKNLTDLTGLEVFTELLKLSCYNNSLTSLDISGNTKLTWLKCSNNNLTELDLTNNTALEYLECADNELTSLNLWNNKNLTNLYCGGNNLTALDVDNNTKLVTLDCSNNALAWVDLRSNTALTALECDGQVVYGLSFTASGTNYTADLSSLFDKTVRQYIDTTSVKAYDYDGNLVTSTLNSNLWKLTLTDVAYYVQYKYNTGFYSSSSPVYMTVKLKTQQTPQIVTTAITSGTLNQEYSFDVKATGESPLTWTITGLPNGLTYSSTTGRISGTPKASGTSSISLTVTNDYGSDTATLSLVIGIAPSITTDSDLGFIKGTSGTSKALAATGSTPITWSLEDNAATTDFGMISNGNLLASNGRMAAGTYTFKVYATNAYGSDSKEFKIRVTKGDLEPPVITTDYLDAAGYEYDYSFALQSKGYLGNDISSQTLTWSLESGSLPAGLTLNSDGTITGAPTEEGTFTFVVKVQNSAGDGETKSITLTVNSTQPEIQTTSLDNADINVAYTCELEAIGSKTISWSLVDGKLPAGLTLKTNGTITGTPTEYGTFTFTVDAYNSQGSDEAELSLTVEDPGIEINEENFPDENFRTYIEGKDTNSNGYLSDTELAAVTLLTVKDNKTVKSLKGIEYFTSLQKLHLTGSNITSVDLSKNTKLSYLYSIGGSLESLDLSNNKNLLCLYVTNNNLTSLDLSNNTNLSTLLLSGNKINELDLTNNTKLTPSDIAKLNIQDQIITGLTVTRSGDVYVSDMSNYVSDVSNISSVLAYDSSENSITSTYADGIIQAESLPAFLKYEYATGLTGANLIVNLKPNSEPSIVNQKALPSMTSRDVINDENYSYTLEALGDTPITWNLESGSLPTGLELNTSTGEISGTPTAANTFKFTISATNSSGTDSQDFTLYIAPVAPIFVTESLDNAMFGEEYSVELNVTGTRPIGFTLSSGSLPDGLSLSSSTGAITGTPSKGGTFEFEIAASNRVDEVRKTFTITVDIEEETAPKITTASLEAALLKTTYSQTLEADGSGDITWSLSSGSLPTGLKITSAGVITGTPTKKGEYTFTVKAENDYGTDTAEFTITVAEVPVFSTTKLTTGTYGKSYNCTIKLKNSNTATWSITDGELPEGLAIDADTGKISGTPTEMCKDREITFKAENDAGSAEKTLKLTIKGVKPVIKSVAKNFATGIVGEEYSADLTYTGTTPITLTATNLPAGLTMSSAGEITGTPTKSGAYSVKFTATNDTGKASKTIKITVYDKPVIADVNLKEGTTGKSYSATIKLSAGPKKVTWSLADGSSMPAGMKFNKSGKISGKPTGYGTFNFTVVATTEVGTAEKVFTLVINPVAPKISTSSLKKGKIDKSYSVKLKSKGTAPLVWSYSGLFPAGITLDTSTGEILGTPTEAGDFNVTISATNDAGTAYKTYKLVIMPLKPVFSVNLSDATVGVSYSAQLTADVGSPVTWTMSPKVPGLTLNSSTGELSGTPTKAKTYKITFKAKNATGTTSQKVTFVVNAAASDSDTAIAFDESVSEIDILTNSNGTGSGSLSEFARGDLTAEMVELAQNEEYSIAAVLPAVTVDESGFYDIAVELYEDITDGELVLFKFPVEDEEPDAQENVTLFFDSEGNEITNAPEDNLVTVSVYLEAGIIYEPVLAIKTR